jgi:hypothetical protein
MNELINIQKKFQFDDQILVENNYGTSNYKYVS